MFDTANLQYWYMCVTHSVSRVRTTRPLTHGRICHGRKPLKKSDKRSSPYTVSIFRASLLDVHQSKKDSDPRPPPWLSRGACQARVVVVALMQQVEQQNAQTTCYIISWECVRNHQPRLFNAANRDLGEWFCSTSINDQLVCKGLARYALQRTSEREI